MKMKYRKQYIVAYFYTTEENVQGWGSMIFVVKGTRPLLNHTKTREQILEKNKNFKNVVLISISEVCS